MAEKNIRDKGVVRLNALSELPEILIAGTLTLLFTPFIRTWLAEHRLIGAVTAFLLLLTSVGLKLIADWLEWKIKAKDSQVMYEVNAYRLKVLEEVGTLEDIVEVLKLRLGQKPMTAEELTKWLEGMLGPERVEETIDTVRRYTQMTRKEYPHGSVQESRV